MKICSSINEILRKKDKINKNNLSFQINADNNYKDKYIQKLIFKKKIENNISSDRKKSFRKQDNLSKRNIYSNDNYMTNNHILKRSQSVADFSKWDKLNKPLDRYYNMENKGGGVWKNNNSNYNLDLSKYYNNYKGNKDNLNIFISKKSKNNEKKKRLTKNNNNIQPYISQYAIKNNYLESNKNKYKKNYINYINNKNKKRFNRSYINTKININEVNRNLNFLKLSKIKNDKKVNLKQYININNKNRKSHSFLDEKNKICENEHFCFENIFKKNKDRDIKNKIFLIRQSNENFSMNNYKIKTFDKLYPIDNIILKYSPTITNQKNKIGESYLTNYTICSNQVEYNIIKEPKLKNDLKENDINKNFIININQISNISPKIKFIQNDNTNLNGKLNEIKINENIPTNDINNNNLKVEIIPDNINNSKINDKKNKIENNGGDKENKIKAKIQIFENKKDLKKINDNINNNEKENSNYKENKIQKRIKEINDNIEKQKNIKKENQIQIINNKEKDKKDNQNKIIQEEINKIKIGEEKQDNKNKNVIKDYNNKDIEKNIKEENNKNSKQFNRFRAGLKKKIENDIKKDGDKYHISAKIKRKATKLEEQIGKQNPEKEEEYVQNSNKIESENQNKIHKLIEQKPVSYKKKKSSKAIFSDE